MPIKEAMGLIAECRGTTVSRELPLNTPVDISITVFSNGERAVGCPQLSEGLCHATYNGNGKNGLPICPHLHPENTRQGIPLFVKDMLIQFPQEETDNILERPSDSEISILNDLARGHTNSEIALKRGVSHATTRTILYKLYKKLNTKGNAPRTEALIKTLRRGLLDIPYIITGFDFTSIRSLNETERRILKVATRENGRFSSVDDLARALYYEKGYINNNLQAIRKKMSTRNTPQAIIYYLLADKLGLVESSESEVV